MTQENVTKLRESNSARIRRLEEELLTAMKLIHETSLLVAELAKLQQESARMVKLLAADVKRSNTSQNNH